MTFGKLLILMPDGQSREFTLEKPEITVGRSRDNMLSLEHLTISRHHACLKVESGKLTVEDLGSANGTFIAAQRLAAHTPQQVETSQLIKFGDVQVHFVPSNPEALTPEDLRTMQLQQAVYPPQAEPLPPAPSRPRTKAAVDEGEEEESSSGSAILEYSKLIIPIVGGIVTACVSGLFVLMANPDFLSHFFPKAEPTPLVETAEAPTPTLEVTSTAALPAFTPTPQAPAILFMDDFSDTNGGWEVDEDENAKREYINGGYMITNKNDHKVAWANPGKFFSDTRIEVEELKWDGPDDNELGLICRYVDSNNMYLFMISSDGLYGIFKKQDGEIEQLKMGATQDSTVLHQGKASNRLRADCLGSNLTFYINDQKMAEAVDNSFTTGDVGLFAGKSAGVKIWFDNFVVYQP